MTRRMSELCDTSYMWDGWGAYRLEISMENAHVVHAAQTSNYYNQLLLRNIRWLVVSRERVCKGTSTSFNLLALGSILK